MSDNHFLLAWVWILAGMLTGAIQGLFFHNEQWMGGYSSWRRRLTRLGHVAFLGTGAINLAFALTLSYLPEHHQSIQIASILLLFGAVMMPTVCYLSAWQKPWRHLFVLPVASLVGGTGIVVIHLIQQTLGAT